MGKEVSTYFILAVLVGMVLFLAYSFNLQLTGLAVFDEAVSGFNGVLENVVYNGSAFVLISDQTSGTYTSEIFDANDSTQWNTLSWKGGIPDSKDNSITNESGWINSSGYALSGFDSSWSEITLIALYSATDNNSPIGLGNATVNSLGVVTNATTDGWSDVLISYDYVSSFDASLSFQVRSCSTSNCANVSFADADLNDMGLLGQYFQYKVDFSTSDSSLSPFLENVVINFPIVSVTIFEPNGTKSSDTGIPIKFVVTGSNLNCWYNINNGENVTLTDCSDSSFNVLDDGNYVFNLYVNNSLGASDYQSSTFLVDTPAPSSSATDDDDESSTSSIVGEVTGQVTQEVVIQLTLSEIQDLVLSPGDSEQLSLSSSNTAITSITSCVLTSIGDFSDWISISAAGEQNLNPGDEIVYSFDLTVPANQELGQYTLILQVKCDNFIQKEDFLVDVITPSEPEEEVVVEEELTPVGGFAIFGDEGIIGTGGAVILIIVVLVLMAVLFIARVMRKSGKTLKDVFNDLKFAFNNFKLKFKK